jgi:hypothetical protein
MRSPSPIKRDLTFALVASALVFFCALAWKGPFIGNNASGAAAGQVTQGQSHSAIFLGTIERSGAELVLREASGRTYKLDNTRPAQAYEGKMVQVAGLLDAGAGMIHVEEIAPGA